MPSKIPSQPTEGATCRLKDDVRRHDWMFKDGPYFLGQPVAGHWAEDQTVCIKLGTSTLPPSKIGPVEYLQNLIDASIDPSEPFHIIADFEPGLWQPEEGFRRLGDYLSFLGTHELDFGSWSRLEICLPDMGIPYESPSTPLIPLDALTSLRRLTWYGHRNQLVNSWLPLTPPILQSLHFLDINCEIAIEDCSRILLHAKRLRHFAVDNIEVNTDQVLTESLRSPENYRSGEHERPYLEFLRIKSSVDIIPLLYPFYFPSLRTISLVLAYPTKIRSLPPAFEWKDMHRVSLVCDLSDADSEWIRKACNADTQHSHINLCRLVTHVQ
ncbi:hypothetical protein DXG01_016271 [Tephrocybe rancida]|nr:hypothetical protein DXG01_016271 [Tephrocybe rancida]